VICSRLAFRARPLGSRLAGPVTLSANDGRASLGRLCPILATKLIAMSNDLENEGKVHGRNARKPMHQALQVILAADPVTHAIKEASEICLSLPCATRAGDSQKAFGVKRCNEWIGVALGFGVPHASRAGATCILPAISVAIRSSTMCCFVVSFVNLLLYAGN